ncbi:MAG: hypothetical protein AAGD00_00530 [Planctomycetota bacterium]
MEHTAKAGTHHTAPPSLHRDERGTGNVQQMLLITLALIVVTVSTKFAHGVITDFDERKQQLEALLNGEEPEEPEAQAMTAEAEHEEEEEPWENPPDLSEQDYLLRQARLTFIHNWMASGHGVRPELQALAEQVGHDGPHPPRVSLYPPAVQRAMVEAEYARRAGWNPQGYPELSESHAGWDMPLFAHDPGGQNYAYSAGGAVLTNWRGWPSHPFNYPDHEWYPYDDEHPHPFHN